MKTPAKKMNIICAIYPNANGFGFVYMENARKLIDFGAVRINPISNRKVLERIKKCFNYFRPTLVISLDPDGKSSRVGRRTRKLITKIIAYAESEKLPVVQYTRDQIRDVFEGFGKTTKYEIAQFLLNEFTELEPKRPRARKLWMSEDRNMAIFDAFSLGLTWFYLND
ncbi:MAG: hypothetical protein IPI45_07110 [Saprospiraceae bacterium]|nr:hypothetical protein [Saprospiraceae bacterium]MBK7737530.1 hypothetical protein [Saprospiraceae bacterium]MBK7913887.1 hypothetical protein [Saprospiraceae bacterium]